MVSSYLFQGCTNIISTPIWITTTIQIHMPNCRTSRDYQSPDRWHPVDPTQASGFGLLILKPPKTTMEFFESLGNLPKKKMARPIDLLQKIFEDAELLPKIRFLCVTFILSIARLPLHNPLSSPTTRQSGTLVMEMDKWPVSIAPSWETLWDKPQVHGDVGRSWKHVKNVKFWRFFLVDLHLKLEKLSKLSSNSKVYLCCIYWLIKRIGWTYFWCFKKPATWHAFDAPEGSWASSQTSRWSRNDLIERSYRSLRSGWSTGQAVGAYSTCASLSSDDIFWINWMFFRGLLVAIWMMMMMMMMMMMIMIMIMDGGCWKNSTQAILAPSPWKPFMKSCGRRGPSA